MTLSADSLRKLFPTSVLENCRPVPEVSAGEAPARVSEQTAFVVRRHPMVLAAAQCCSVDALMAACDEREIVVEHKHRWEASTLRTTARAYLSSLDTTDYYWRQERMTGIHVALPGISIRRDAVPLDYLWVGPAGTVQTFHQDNHDDLIVNSNSFMQTQGMKYVAVASHKDSDVFEAKNVRPGYRRHSALSPFEPSVWHEAGTLCHAVLLPGDLIFIPPRAWHYVQSMSPSISISRWWFESRIAETVFLSATQAESTHAGGDLAPCSWQEDIVAAGRPALMGFLARLPPTEKYLAIRALVRRYGQLIYCDLQSDWA